MLQGTKRWIYPYHYELLWLYTEMESLAHEVVLFLMFWGSSILFFIKEKKIKQKWHTNAYVLEWLIFRSLTKKCWWGCKKQELTYCWWEGKIPLWKTVWQFLRNQTLSYHRVQQIQSLVLHKGVENLCPNKYLYMALHNSFIHNCHTWKQPRRFYRWMSKWTVAPPDSGVLLSTKKKSSSSHDKTGRNLNVYYWVKEVNLKIHTLCGSRYMIF